MPPRIKQIRQPIAHRLNQLTAKCLPDRGISHHEIEPLSLTHTCSRPLPLNPLSCYSSPPPETKNPPNVPGSNNHAIPSHHAARAQSRCRAEVLPGCAGAEGGAADRERQGAFHAGVPVLVRRPRGAEEAAADARRAAGRAHLELGRGKIRRGPL